VASIRAGPCWCGNGDNQRRSPGRARISRKAIARGKSGCLGCTCGACPCAFRTWDARVLQRTGSTGAVSARLSLRPLSERGTMNWQDSDKSCRENTRCRPGEGRDPYAAADIVLSSMVAGFRSTTADRGYGSRPSPGRQPWVWRHRALYRNTSPVAASSSPSA
jgi:hypothetical protein